MVSFLIQQNLYQKKICHMDNLEFHIKQSLYDLWKHYLNIISPPGWSCSTSGGKYWVTKKICISNANYLLVKMTKNNLLIRDLLGLKAYFHQNSFINFPITISRRLKNYLFTIWVNLAFQSSPLFVVKFFRVREISENLYISLFPSLSEVSKIDSPSGEKIAHNHRKVRWRFAANYRH